MAFAMGVSAQDSSSKPSSKAGQEKSFIAAPQRQLANEKYIPITSRERMRWFVNSTVGPTHLLGGGIFSAAIGTAMDRPKEYGPHWEGFADRFGMRLTGISTGNVMEVGLGAIWGEDPRYFVTPEKPLKSRICSVIWQTFEARHPNGNYAPAYARYIAVTGNNFLSNTWRVDSESNLHDALIRTAEGFAGRMAGNAWEEFWPSIKGRVFSWKQHQK